MRISDWSSDVCSSDLPILRCRADLLVVARRLHDRAFPGRGRVHQLCQRSRVQCIDRTSRLARSQAADGRAAAQECRLFDRSEEHTSELQSLMRISYAVFCLKKKKIQ